MSLGVFVFILIAIHAAAWYLSRWEDARQADYPRRLRQRITRERIERDRALGLPQTVFEVD